MTSQVTGWVPPHDLEMEACLLGACLVGGAPVVSEVSGRLRHEDFYRQNHGEVYQAMLQLARAGEPIDNVTVAAELERRGLLEQVGGRANLGLFQEAVPTAANAGYYALGLQELALTRRTIEVGTEIARQGYQRSLPARELLSQGQQRLMELAVEGARSDFQHLKEGRAAILERAEAQRAGVLPGLSTGFMALDRLTGGFKRSELTVVGAATGMGKTSFLLGSALQIARCDRRPVAIFSLEMSRPTLEDRLACMVARIDSARKGRGELSEQEWDRFHQAMDSFEELPIYIDDDSALTPLSMLAKARSLHDREGLALIVVDYLQLLRGRSQENRVREVGDFTRALREMARELQVPVLAASSLSRAPDGRTDKRPNLSDLRESGEIEFTSDVILFLYRDDYYRSDTPKPGVAEVIVAKNRNGPTGRAELAWLRHLTLFQVLSSRTVQ